MNNWKILIVTNNRIVPEFYQNDPKFNSKNWTIFNVSNKERMQSSDKFSVVNALDIPNYEFLGKDWAESEVIYNVSKLNLFPEFDYLGIIHWDFNLYASDYETSRITENISNILEKYHWISFFPAFYKNISGYYNVLLDERKPNCLFVRDSNLENPKDANHYVQNLMVEEKLATETNLKDINPNALISLCCSFLTERKHFNNIGKLIGKSYESRIFDKFDTEKRHRIPGQVMERLVALYQVNPYCPLPFTFKLDHRFIGGNEINKNDPNGENY